MLSLQSSKVCKADESADRGLETMGIGERSRRKDGRIETRTSMIWNVGGINLFKKGGEVDSIDEGRQTFQYDESGHPPNSILETSH